jgi:hypothetical protein
MANTSGRIAESRLGESFAKARFSNGGIRYRAENQDNEVFFEFDLPSIHGRRALEYFIGSGAAERSYLFSIGDFLYQAPVSYFSGAARWDLSPGFEQHEGLYLTRPVTTGCLNCHSSWPQPREGTLNGYSKKPFLEGGIACEQCHGAGDVHTSSGKEIVNPARLPARERDAVCEQCHLTGEARVARLDGSMVAFVWEDAAAGMEVASHVEKLAQSRCKQASGDKLWCGTCHNPHAAPTHIEARCVACHRSRSCDRGADCTGCHMPKSAVRDVEHAVYTDHSIPKSPRSVVPVSKHKRLIPFGGADASDREFGLAYASLPGFESQAIQYLQKVKTKDADVLTQLAYLTGGEEAVPLYEQALKLDPGQWTASANLGAAYLQQGKLAKAVERLLDAIARSPGNEAARFNLAQAYLRSGNRDAAATTLRELLQLNPGNGAARRLADEIRLR